METGTVVIGAIGWEEDVVSVGVPPERRKRTLYALLEERVRRGASVWTCPLLALTDYFRH